MNLQNLNLVELNAFDTIEVNGGELPYTDKALDGASIAKGVTNFIHQAGDFLRGFTSAF
ncbi:bacteriocin [Flavobacterium sp. CHNK8]|uniref:bacteriocin n=1 Tax=Flavobacterium sp. CHNK8 TaxID=2871165 RepID=UPI001C8E3A19|nr:bacteriocin [Flavobacterium sp. CHNK8]QZK88983.1 bacteriocin [Flavobacterium sp. CHNK8]